MGAAIPARRRRPVFGVARRQGQRAGFDLTQRHSVHPLVHSDPAVAEADGVLGFVANCAVTVGALAADADEVSRQSEHHHPDDG